MINWYDDDELAIKFDKMPALNVRYASPWMTKEEAKELNKKPFICEKELYVRIEDKIEQEIFEFTIPEGYTWDGATIPRIFWRLIGSKSDNRFLVPSLIHDVLCENKDFIDNNRALSTDAFNGLLKVAKVNPVSRFFMKNFVAMFQTLFCKW